MVSQSIHYQSPAPEPSVHRCELCPRFTETLLGKRAVRSRKRERVSPTRRRSLGPASSNWPRAGHCSWMKSAICVSPGQAKLLRVLEEKIVVPRRWVRKTIHTDVRVIAATNQDLADLVRHKPFVEDLYFRLNVVTLVLPPLRERPADIIPLAEFFLALSLASRAGPGKCPAGRFGPASFGVASLAGQTCASCETCVNGWPICTPPTRSRPMTWRSSCRRRPNARRRSPRICRWPRRPIAFRSSTFSRPCVGRGRQHERRGRKARPAPLEPVPQDATAEYAALE